MAIYVTGDIHGDPREVRDRINQIPNVTSHDFLIFAGDVAISYGTYYNAKVKEEMSKFPGTCIIMRGNHDTRYWRDNTDDSGWPTYGWVKIVRDNEIYLVQKRYPNIWYVRDEGGIYSIDRKNVLFIPGAYSVDSMYRVYNNSPYEPQEQLTYQEMVNLFDKMDSFLLDNQIDYIVSHTAPSFLEEYIEDLFLGSVPQYTVDKSMETWMNNFVHRLNDNFKQWVFGHFHDDRQILDKYTMLYHKVLKLGE